MKWIFTVCKHVLRRKKKKKMDKYGFQDTLWGSGEVEPTAHIMMMTSDFRAHSELSPECVADGSWSYIRDEIFNIPKLCHHSGGVVPCVEFTQTHTARKEEMVMHRTTYRSCGMFVSALQMWLIGGSAYMLLRGFQPWTCNVCDSEKDVMLPPYACVAKPAVAWSFLCGNSPWQMWSEC